MPAITINFIVVLITLFILLQSAIQQTSITTQYMLNSFYQNYTKAMKYDVNYYINYFQENNENSLSTIFSDINKLTEYFYLNNPPGGYVVSFPNSAYVFFSIMVNPCLNSLQYCCEGLAICKEDNPEIIANGDLELAWSTNNLLPLCENEFNNDSCGMFLEIHLPGNPQIINDYKIDEYYVNGFYTIFITTKKLCSGRFELWFVLRMRGANLLIYVKPIYVKYPSCTCDYVTKLGYICK